MPLACEIDPSIASSSAPVTIAIRPLVEWTASKCAAGKPKGSEIFCRWGLDTVSRVGIAREIRFYARVVLAVLAGGARRHELEIAQNRATSCFARRVTDLT
jgi:hypothetical protein